MGFFFTLLYLLFSFVTPTALLGQLGEYHIEMIIAVLAVITSIPSLRDSGIQRFPQTWASLALTVMVVISLLQTGWMGGVFRGGYSFVTVIAGFFLVAINCRTPRHLQLIVLALMLGSFFFIGHAVWDLQNGVSPSPYIYGQMATPRIRGLGLVNDPNDLAQVLVSLIPLVFLWRTRSRIVNIFAVGVPIALLITGMYLTHSRGSSVALMAVLIVAFRRKIGTVPAIIIAGAVFAAALSFGWSGGRDVSMEAGADRLDAWSQGLTFIKTHPLLGIGYGQFAELYYITAHNSVVVCAAETGVPGLFCWVLLLLSSFRLCLKMIRVPDTASTEPAEVAEAAPAFSRFLPGAPVPAMAAGSLPPAWRPASGGRQAALSPHEFWASARSSGAAAVLPANAPGSLDAGAPARFAGAGASVAAATASQPADVPDALTGQQPEALAEVPVIDPAEARRIAGLLMVALVGFLTAGWFLSRAYSVWLFMYCGMTCALVRMAHASGIDIQLDRPRVIVRWAAIIAVTLIVVVYVILRVRNVLGR